MSAPVQQEKRQTAREMPPITLQLRPVIELTPDQLLELSSLNDDLRMELSSEGALVIMSPTSWESTRRNEEIAFQLGAWARQDGTGCAAESSGGFRLPNGATRSPDVAWVERRRIDALTAEQRGTVVEICPDFVIELRSLGDRINVLKRKMQEWIDNGSRLGWLIDPDAQRVYVYRPDAPMQQFDNSGTLAGDPVLPGFVLNLTKIW